MVRRSLMRWTLAMLALAGARETMAGPIQMSTGNVETDMAGTGTATVAPFTNPGGGMITSYSGTGTTAPVTISNNYAGAVAPDISTIQAPGLTVKDVRTSYDKVNDQLAIGVNFYGVAGSINGVPVGNLLGKESISLGIDFAKGGSIPSVNNPPGAFLVAGIPTMTSEAGTGLNGFKLVSVRGNDGGGIESQYQNGTSLTNHFAPGQGLVYQPSADHKGFEILLNNASKLPGFSPTSNMFIEVYAGSSNDTSMTNGSVVEKGTDWLNFGAVALETPEPATILAWSAVALGAGWRGARKRRRDGLSA